MFIIASSGRCGTEAICHGLDRFSDHVVEHEPEPRLLREAHLKHLGEPYRTSTYEERMRFFRDRAHTRYGQSFRAPNLLEDIDAAAARARFLVVVRTPGEYVVSAHALGVLRRGDEWDQARILPRGVTEASEQGALAARIAWHWDAVNRYLLDFAERSGPLARVVVLCPLEEALPRWAAWLGVRIEDPAGLRDYLASKPNAAPSRELPEGYDPTMISRICGETWRRAERLAHPWT